jgi:DNA-binding MarR family transcriptional regulator
MVRSSEVSYQLIATSRLLEQAGDVVLDEFGITMAMYELMMMVARGFNTTTELARQSRSTLANITHKTKSLEEAGYLRREISHQDRRIWKLSLTAEGRRLLDSVESYYEKAVNRLFSEFSEKELETTLDLLIRTRQHLELMLGQEDELRHFASELRNSRGG